LLAIFYGYLRLLAWAPGVRPGSKAIVRELFQPDLFNSAAQGFKNLEAVLCVLLGIAILVAFTMVLGPACGPAQ